MQSLAQKQSPTRQQPKSVLAKPDASAAGNDLHAIQNLQRSAGNQAVLHLLRSQAPDSSDHPNSPGTGTPLSPPLRPTRRLTLQTKLTVNAPGDAYEQEADRVAEQVMRMPEPQRACSCGGTCDHCKKKQDSPHLQMKSVSGSDVGQTEAPPRAHEVLRQPGQPLDAATRAFMEPRFSQDFSGVRIHTGNLASDSARDVAARAYTVGSHIVFRDGEFSPEDDNGRRLLAHELIHTIQQPSASGMIQRQPASEAPSNPDAARKISTLMSLYAIYVDRLDYIEKQDGKVMALINPQGHHFVEITWDAAAPKLQSFIVIDEETWTISNFNFDTNRFETQEEHIKQELIEVKLSFWERLANSARFSARVVQGVGTCVGGAAESVGFGAYAACAYGADVLGAGYRELQGQDPRTLSNQLVTKGLSQVLSPELSQKIANYTEIAVDAAMLAHGAASARASKLGIPKTATKVPSSQVAPKAPELVAGDAEATAASGEAKAAPPARPNATTAHAGDGTVVHNEVKPPASVEVRKGASSAPDRPEPSPSAPKASGQRRYVQPPPPRPRGVKAAEKPASAEATTPAAQSKGKYPPGQSGNKTPTRIKPDQATVRPRGEPSVADADVLSQEGTNRQAVAYRAGDQHHIFPQELEDWFNERFRGTEDIHEYTVTISEGEHGAIHTTAKGGIVKGVQEPDLVGWNQEWKVFKEAHPLATPQEIFEEAGRMMAKYRISEAPISRYGQR